jgi:hypothetical protein
MEKIWIRDGKNSDQGSGINIPGLQHFDLVYILDKKCLVLTTGLTDCCGVKQAIAQSLIVFPSKNCLPRMSQTPWLGTEQSNGLINKT